VAWCELRSDFRLFRTDRMETLTVLGEPLPKPRRALLQAFREQEAQRAAQWERERGCDGHAKR